MAVDGGLLFGLHAGERRPDLLADIARGFAGAFAQIARLIAIAQLHGFVFAGGGAGGNGGAAHAAIGQVNVGLDGGIAAAV